LASGLGTVKEAAAAAGERLAKRNNSTVPTKEVNTDIINHVKQNIALTGKINKIKEIQLFYRNFVKDRNQKKIQQFLDEKDIVSRSLSLEQAHRWKEFRGRRDQAVDEYVEAKKRLLRAKRLISSATLHGMIRRCWRNYQEQKAYVHA